MWYNYIYLNPEKQGIFIYDDLEFEYEPFYVGKGTNNRYKSHLYEKKGTNKHKINKIQKILKNFTKEDYIKNFILILNQSDNEKDVLLKESELINKIGTVLDVSNVPKRGPLLNALEGGISNPVLNGQFNPMYGKSIFDVWVEKFEENIAKEKYEKWIMSLRGKQQRLGIKHTNETKKIISEKNKGKIRTDDVKQKIRESHFGKTSNKKGKKFEDIYGERAIEIKMKISKSSIGRKQTDDTKIKIRMKHIGRIFSVEHKKRISESKKGKKLSNKTKMKISNATTGEKNPMFGKGYKLQGTKNGRSLMIIVHFPDNKKYFCNGSFTKFCDDVLSKIKPQPHRKYFDRCIKENSVIDGWYFKKLSSITEININDYIIYC